MPSQPITVPEAEPVQLVAITRRETPEVAVESLRVDERRLDLAERGEQRVGEAARGRGR